MGITNQGYKMPQEMSEYGNYPLRQTEAQFEENLMLWEEQVKATLKLILNALTPEIRAKAADIHRKALDLTERLCLETDKDRHKRMTDSWKQVSKRCGYDPVKSILTYFHPEDI